MSKILFINKILFSILLGISCVGCITLSKEPDIYAAKTWEGHFKTKEEYEKSLEKLDDEEFEPRWVLSERTLIRVLKNQGK